MGVTVKVFFLVLDTEIRRQDEYWPDKKQKAAYLRDLLFFLGAFAAPYFIS